MCWIVDFFLFSSFFLLYINSFLQMCMQIQCHRNTLTQIVIIVIVWNYFIFLWFCNLQGNNFLWRKNFQLEIKFEYCEYSMRRFIHLHILTFLTLFLLIFFFCVHRSLSSSEYTWIIIWFALSLFPHSFPFLTIIMWFRK